ncbi:hypothetical protein AAG570_009868 [Ranatra chinensis]|uniref:Uncharacterized protein n=1 Tax=Ranatra chinensis TaxID=642074 RepID=A0ABD0YQF7_9HEMI
MKMGISRNRSGATNSEQEATDYGTSAYPLLTLSSKSSGEGESYRLLYGLHTWSSSNGPNVISTLGRLLRIRTLTQLWHSLTALMGSRHTHEETTRPTSLRELKNFYSLIEGCFKEFASGRTGPEDGVGLSLRRTLSPGPNFNGKVKFRVAIDGKRLRKLSHAGEVERLLREYRQNQELVRNIGAHYYQIIYPVQLRHHEKMGISTREVGAPKIKIFYETEVFG